MKAVGGITQTAVEIGGSALAAGDQSTLETVRVEQRLSTPAQCELVFLNPAGPLADASVLPEGSALRVTTAGSSNPLFAGEITAVEHGYDARGHEVRLRAYDVLHRLRKQQPVKAHVQVTIRELAVEMGARIGVTVQSAEDGPVLHRLIQHWQSDFDLLTDAAERCGLYLTLRGGALHLLTLDGVGEPIPLSLGEKLMEARIEVNGEGACRTVSASAWDPWRVERHQARAVRARVGRRVAAEAPPGRFGATGERTLTGEVAQDDQQTEALAQAELDWRVGGEVILQGTSEGDPRLSPGTRVAVQGIAAALAGAYVLTAVSHRIDRRTGFVSEFTSEPPAPRPRRRSASVALGLVSRVDDPDGLGRVKVSLPAYGNVETDWMSVVSMGAGAAKGFVMLPDAGDQVLVVLAQDDPAQGVVLGGLYSSAAHPDFGVEGGAVRRCALLTPGGQKFQVDDTHSLLRLENSDGSKVEISPERVLIHSKTRLEIEAVDQPVVIRGRSIDFQRG